MFYPKVTILITILLIKNIFGEDLRKKYNDMQKMKTEVVEDFKRNIVSVNEMIRNAPAQLVSPLKCNLEITQKLPDFMELHFLNVYTGQEKLEEARKEWTGRLKATQIIIQDIITSLQSLIGKRDKKKIDKVKIELQDLCQVLMKYMLKIRDAYFDVMGLFAKAGLSPENIDETNLLRALKTHPSWHNILANQIFGLGDDSTRAGLAKIRDVIGKI